MSEIKLSKVEIMSMLNGHVIRCFAENNNKKLLLKIPIMYRCEDFGTLEIFRELLKEGQ